MAAAQERPVSTMRNLIILGTGRSGTSMATALFRNDPDVFYGHEIIGATEANPYGYYEDDVINKVNDMLIKRMLGTWILDVLPAKLSRRAEKLLCEPVHRDYRALWLAAPRRWPRGRLPRDFGRLMGALTRRQPFCYKDPRFSVTLPFWRPHLPDDTQFLVVYRDPDRTVDSMLRDARQAYARPLPLTPRWAFTCWFRTYSRLFDVMAREEQKWLLVSYDQIMNKQALPALARFAEADVDAGQLDPSVSRSDARAQYDFGVARRCRDLYRRLEQRSTADVTRWSGQATP